MPVCHSPWSIQDSLPAVWYGRGTLTSERPLSPLAGDEAASTQTPFRGGVGKTGVTRVFFDPYNLVIKSRGQREEGAR